MRLTARKLIVLMLIGLVVLLANVMVVAAWLERHGVIETAETVRREFLTGTAITILVALLILLVEPGGRAIVGMRRRCRVCGEHAAGPRYCGECGSRQ